MFNISMQILIKKKRKKKLYNFSEHMQHNKISWKIIKGDVTNC